MKPRTTWHTTELIQMRDWIALNCPGTDIVSQVNRAQKACLPVDRQRPITNVSLAQQAITRMKNLPGSEAASITVTSEPAPTVLQLSTEELVKLAPHLAKGTRIELV